MRFVNFLADQQGGWNAWLAASQQQQQQIQEKIFWHNMLSLLFKGLGLAIIIFIVVKVATHKSKDTDQNS